MFGWVGCAGLQEGVEPIVDTSLAVRMKEEEISLPEFKQERGQPEWNGGDGNSSEKDPLPMARTDV
ncbi:hypothetical protein BCY86_01780 [Pajaroellobacter abortibovis]|uniref:Uncharacterized protein n=2 Tax=Pajaroellobacter abortibovis TaxID=1882918 RepID=A0A1L6MVI2_9BACT|nr:hypothetical protein BCY86_01780 [Pajaroellobacter abortibovis]